MPKTVDHDERRADFVAASWDVIAREGLPATTLRRVASQAGCTTGALTHYFADRKSLLVEALRAAHASAGRRMRAAIAREADPRKRLSAVLHEASPLDAERLREWKVWLAFWGAAAGDPTLAEENRRRYAEWRDLLERLVRPFTGDAAPCEADLLVALVDGLGVRLALLDASALDDARRMATAHLDTAMARLARVPA